MNQLEVSRTKMRSVIFLAVAAIMAINLIWIVRYFFSTNTIPHKNNMVFLSFYWGFLFVLLILWRKVIRPIQEFFL